jgi:DNA repair exonuclease SbcCD nuclease subunit
MTNLFKRAAVCTDLHYGLKSNSLQHNTDCSNFIKWFCNEAKKEGCDTAMFLGDWHNHRASINLQTLQHSLESIELLSQTFDRVFFIPGNHDLYYRDRRDISSIEWAKHLDNVHILNDFHTEGDVVFAPWLVSDDYKKIPKLKGEYLMGHFELPHFKMNAMVEMPDHGELQLNHFDNFGSVFSGHFHMRQTKGNITYMGNCFPHNFADAGDDERGMMILDWGQQPQYRAWPDQPKYRVYNLSNLVERPGELLDPNMYVRVLLDVDISYEEASFIKETFVEEYKCRDIALIKKQMEFEEEIDTGELKFESVDQIVTDQLTRIDGGGTYQSKLLLEIYQNL